MANGKTIAEQLIPSTDVDACHEWLPVACDCRENFFFYRKVLRLGPDALQEWLNAKRFLPPFWLSVSSAAFAIIGLIALVASSLMHPTTPDSAMAMALVRWVSAALFFVPWWLVTRKFDRGHAAMRAVRKEVIIRYAHVPEAASAIVECVAEGDELFALFPPIRGDLLFPVRNGD